MCRIYTVVGRSQFLYHILIHMYMEERELLDVGEIKERHRERDTKEMRVGI